MAPCGPPDYCIAPTGARRPHRWRSCRMVGPTPAPFALVRLATSIGGDVERSRKEKAAAKPLAVCLVGAHTLSAPQTARIIQCRLCCKGRHGMRNIFRAHGFTPLLRVCWAWKCRLVLAQGSVSNAKTLETSDPHSCSVWSFRTIAQALCLEKRPRRLRVLADA